MPSCIDVSEFMLVCSIAVPTGKHGGPWSVGDGRLSNSARRGARARVKISRMLARFNVAKDGRSFFPFLDALVSPGIQPDGRGRAKLLFLVDQQSWGRREKKSDQLSPSRRNGNPESRVQVREEHRRGGKGVEGNSWPGSPGPRRVDEEKRRNDRPDIGEGMNPCRLPHPLQEGESPA